MCRKLCTYPKRRNEKETISPLAPAARQGDEPPHRPYGGATLSGRSSWLRWGGPPLGASSAPGRRKGSMGFSWPAAPAAFSWAALASRDHHAWTPGGVLQSDGSRDPHQNQSASFSSSSSPLPPLLLFSTSPLLLFSSSLFSLLSSLFANFIKQMSRVSTLPAGGVVPQFPAATAT